MMQAIKINVQAEFCETSFDIIRQGYEQLKNLDLDYDIILRRQA